jgi:hypothetical protein
MGGFAQYGGAYPGMQPYGFGGQEYQAYGNQGGNDAPGNMRPRVVHAVEQPLY